LQTFAVNAAESFVLTDIIHLQYEIKPVTKIKILPSFQKLFVALNKILTL